MIPIPLLVFHPVQAFGTAWLLYISGFFRKKSGRLSSASPEISAFVRHCSANFQPILNCFIPSLKLKCKDSENIKAGRVNTVAFKLHQIKRRALFLGHPVW